MARQLDFKTTRRVARQLSNEALLYSARDAWEAAEAAEDIDRAGARVGSDYKDGGYYRDEASVYRAELRRRSVRRRGGA